MSECIQGHLRGVHLSLMPGMGCSVVTEQAEKLRDPAKAPLLGLFFRLFLTAFRRLRVGGSRYFLGNRQTDLNLSKTSLFRYGNTRYHLI